MKVLTIIGARPQFIKAAIVSKTFSSKGIEEIIVHTGQHFDYNMSQVFFDEMQIPKPKYNLEINSLSHGAMTGRMIEEIEEVILTEQPQYVMVYGDTNTTLAAAIATKKLAPKLIHIEAGLRSFNMQMPEEINRILTDRISDLLFCPTKRAIKNLKEEGFDHFDSKIVLTGDVMYDSVLYFSKYAVKPNLNISGDYILTTIHRAENTDDLIKLKNIVNALMEVAKSMPVYLVLHPRTRKILDHQSFNISSSNLQIIEPLSYLEMIYMTMKAKLVMTDSGGLQKESFFFNKKCVVLREQTEWVELVENGYNALAGSNYELILEKTQMLLNSNVEFSNHFYGNGNASEIIADTLLSL
jgi:UDP-GlcNAc3NAcA epimerase